jgi:hypothetical protein
VLISLFNHANSVFYLFHKAKRDRQCLATMISMAILASMLVVCPHELVHAIWSGSSVDMEGNFHFLHSIHYDSINKCRNLLSTYAILGFDKTVCAKHLFSVTFVFLIE